MDFNLPDQTKLYKYVAKDKFYKKAIVSSKLKEDFVNQIQRITRTHKLAEDTLWITKTDQVEEIQIFEIQLKQKQIPKKVLQLIDKSIPYPILYVFVFDTDKAYGITLKWESWKQYYFSEWNQKLSFNFNEITLEKVYQWLIASFIETTSDSPLDFGVLIDNDKKRKDLEKEIQSLENKIKKEKQFNKKVNLNQELLHKKAQLASIQI